MLSGEDIDLDVEMSAPPTVPNKVNLYGVSNLSTKEISAFVKSILNDSIHIKVEWIDDDSCNIVFPDDSFVESFLSLGQPIEAASMDGSLSLAFQPVPEGEEPQMLSIRRANESDSKNPARSWRDSGYYKTRLEEKGINPETLAPVSRVILKPREGAKVPQKKSTKVSLIPRHLVNKARSAMYGDDAFSKRKERANNEEELQRREQRAKRFNAHS